MTHSVSRDLSQMAPPLFCPGRVTYQIAIIFSLENVAFILYARSHRVTYKKSCLWTIISFAIDVRFE